MQSNTFFSEIFQTLMKQELYYISSKTKTALQLAKSRGVKLGTKDPIKSVRLMNCGATQNKKVFAKNLSNTINQIIQDGRYTLVDIAEYLNISNISTRNDKIWYASGVRNLVRELMTQKLITEDNLNKIRFCRK